MESSKTSSENRCRVPSSRHSARPRRLPYRMRTGASRSETCRPGPYLIRVHLQNYLPSRGRIIQVSADGRTMSTIELTRRPGGSTDPAVLAAGVGRRRRTCQRRRKPKSDARTRRGRVATSPFETQRPEGSRGEHRRSRRRRFDAWRFAFVVRPCRWRLRSTARRRCLPTCP